jgi:transglutaminase-like putative cysteine protease
VTRARRLLAAGVVAAAVALAAFASPVAADELAVYRATTADAGLFDQYDNDGYSLAVSPGTGGSLELRVRVSGQPLASRSPFPTGMPREPGLPASPERDAFAQTLASGARTQAEAVERILSAIASSVRYDTDRSRLQDPATVFASRRAHCVGFAELAVDLLRRVGIPARTVQGILRAKPGTDGYDAAIGGVYHRWIEIYYPDRGFVFSDPSSSINSVDSRYVPFGKRALERPRGLTLTQIEASGRLDYPILRLPDATLRVRPVGAAP